MSNQILRVPNRLGWAPTGLRIAGLLAIIAMLVNVVLDVLLRSFFNSPVQGTLELMTYWYMVAIALIGMWAAQSSDEHISVTILAEKSDSWTRHWLRLFVGLITIGYVVLIAYFGFTTALENMTIGEYAGASRVPIWPARFLIPIGLGAFALTLMLQLVRAAKAGPSAAIESDHLDIAADQAVASKMRNMGQTCVSVNRIIVHESVADRFLEKLIFRYRAQTVGDPLHAGVTVGPLIEDAAIDKVERQVADAVERGARIALGGSRTQVDNAAGVNFFEPTIITNVDYSMLIATEETFGPMVAVMSFSTEEEAMQISWPQWGATT